MRKILIFLALSASVPAIAQTQGTLSVKDGNGSLQSVCNVSSVAGSVIVPCSNLYVQGAQVATGNPVPVSGTVTASLSGSISNTSFGISGALPAFASTPTFNIGTAPSLTIGTLPGITVADGSDTTLGAKADAAWSSGSGSLIAISKGIYGALVAPLPGAVSTAAPSYTSGTTNSISLTTGGALRSDLSSYNSTALTGTVTAYGTAPTGNVFGVNASVTNSVAVGNIATIASSTPAYSISNGSTNKAAAVTIGTAVAVTDQSATAFAGSGSVNGTVVASAQGGGAVVSSEINVSALTLGTASSVFAILQESTGGTNFSDIWVSDPITTASIVRMPAVPVAGRRRWRFFSAGGTSTTVTATITTLELPAGYPLERQMRDAFSATNPFALQYNSATLAASTFVLGTISTSTTPFYIEGTKQITAFMTLAGSPTVTTQPVVTLQLSMDAINWWNVSGATLAPTGNGTFATTYAGTAKFARLIVTTAAVYSAGSYTISNIGVNAVN